jgi:hypothetical protein
LRHKALSKSALLVVKIGNSVLFSFGGGSLPLTLIANL